MSSASAAMRSNLAQNLQTVQDAVLNKQYTLFDANIKDDFDRAFSGLEREERKRLVAEMSQGVRENDLSQSRAAVERLLYKRRPAILRNSSWSRWLLFVCAWGVALKSSFSASFGGGAMHWGVDIVLSSLYLFAVVWQGGVAALGPLDALVLFPSYTVSEWAECVRSLAASWRFLQGLRNVVEGSLTRLLGLFLILVSLGHLVACTWYALAVYQSFSASFGPGDVFANANASTPLTYFRVYFFALKSLTGGFDGSPTTGLEIALALGIVVAGFTVTATTVGSIGSALMGLDAEREAWIAKNDEASRYAKANSLPDALFRRISDYYRYLKENRRSSAQPQEIFYELPSSLQTDISLHLTTDLLSQVSFFQGAPLPCLSFVAKQLKPLAVPPGERIVTEGEVGESMFFLMRGLVEVTSGLRVVTLLAEGAVFGEMALLVPNQPRTATIRALVFSDVFELSQRDLEEVLKLWPDLRVMLTRTMEKRIAQTEKAIGRTITEVPASPAPVRSAAEEEAAVRKAKVKNTFVSATNEILKRVSTVSLDATQEDEERKNKSL